MSVGSTYPYLSVVSSVSQRKKRTTSSTAGCHLVEIMRHNTSVSVHDVTGVKLVEVDSSGQVGYNSHVSGNRLIT